MFRFLKRGPEPTPRTDGAGGAGDKTNGTTKAVVANLGEANKFYYNQELKRWVIKGEEEAARKEIAAFRPPPTAVASRSSFMPTECGATAPNFKNEAYGDSQSAVSEAPKPPTSAADRMCQVPTFHLKRLQNNPRGGAPGRQQETRWQQQNVVPLVFRDPYASTAPETAETATATPGDQSSDSPAAAQAVEPATLSAVNKATLPVECSSSSWPQAYQPEAGAECAGTAGAGSGVYGESYSNTTASSGDEPSARPGDKVLTQTDNEFSARHGDLDRNSRGLVGPPFFDPSLVEHNHHHHHQQPQEKLLVQQPHHNHDQQPQQPQWYFQTTETLLKTPPPLAQQHEQDDQQQMQLEAKPQQSPLREQELVLDTGAENQWTNPDGDDYAVASTQKLGNFGGACNGTPDDIWFSAAPKPERQELKVAAVLVADSYVHRENAAGLCVGTADSEINLTGADVGVVPRHADEWSRRPPPFDVAEPSWGRPPTVTVDGNERQNYVTATPAPGSDAASGPAPWQQGPPALTAETPFYFYQSYYENEGRQCVASEGPLSPNRSAPDQAYRPDVVLRPTDSVTDTGHSNSFPEPVPLGPPQAPLPPPSFTTPSGTSSVPDQILGPSAGPSEFATQLEPLTDNDMPPRFATESREPEHIIRGAVAPGESYLVSSLERDAGGAAGGYAEYANDPPSQETIFQQEQEQLPAAVFQRRQYAPLGQHRPTPQGPETAQYLPPEVARQTNFFPDLPESQGVQGVQPPRQDALVFNAAAAAVASYASSGPVTGTASRAVETATQPSLAESAAAPAQPGAPDATGPSLDKGASPNLLHMAAGFVDTSGHTHGLSIKPAQQEREVDSLPPDGAILSRIVSAPAAGGPRGDPDTHDVATGSAAPAERSVGTLKRERLLGRITGARTTACREKYQDQEGAPFDTKGKDDESGLRAFLCVEALNEKLADAQVALLRSLEKLLGAYESGRKFTTQTNDQLHMQQQHHQRAFAELSAQVEARLTAFSVQVAEQVAIAQTQVVNATHERFNEYAAELELEREEKNEASLHLRRMGRDLESTKLELDKQTRANKKVEHNLQTANLELDKQRIEIQLLTEENNRMRATNVEAIKETTAARDERIAEYHKRTTTELELNEAKITIHTLNAEIEKARSTAHALESEIPFLKKQLEALTAANAHSEENFRRVKADYEASAARHEEESDGLKNHVAELQESVQALTAERNSLIEEVRLNDIAFKDDMAKANQLIMHFRNGYASTEERCKALEAQLHATRAAQIGIEGLDNRGGDLVGLVNPTHENRRPDSLEASTEPARVTSQYG